MTGIRIIAAFIAITCALGVASGTVNAPSAAASTPPASAPKPAAASQSCPKNLAWRLDAGTSRQLITIEVPNPASTLGRLQMWSRSAKGCWVAYGPAMIAQLGRNGIGKTREGDHKTPVGSYTIGSRMYGTDLNPGVKYPYRKLQCGDWWDSKSASGGYNTFQHVDCAVRYPFGGPGVSEPLWQIVPQYQLLAVIGWNPTRTPGKGSGIFLHVSVGHPTAGCVALPKAGLVAVLRWLRPAASPRIIIGTPAQLTSMYRQR